MIPSLRQHFNASYTEEKYSRLRDEMTARAGMEIPFALCETPCFFPRALVERMTEDGKALIRQLVDNPDIGSAPKNPFPKISASRTKPRTLCSSASTSGWYAAKFEMTLAAKPPSSFDPTAATSTPSSSSCKPSLPSTPINPCCGGSVERSPGRCGDPRRQGA
jgi:hypothetical protein